MVSEDKQANDCGDEYGYDDAGSFFGEGKDGGGMEGDLAKAGLKIVNIYTYPGAGESLIAAELAPGPFLDYATAASRMKTAHCHL